ncbi:MAG: hypothetical protein OQL19_22200 [Gammaproteobacteria bacterium]|nr:hypothetical protein [Gammaproteobacteria bacterium]
MDNEINKLKKEINIIRPLISKNKIQLDEMKGELDEKINGLKKSQTYHEEVELKKSQLMNQIQMDTEMDCQLNLIDMNNARYYFSSLDDELKEAHRLIEHKEASVELLRQDINTHQLNINNLEQYNKKKGKSLLLEQEKQNMKILDDLWMHKLSMEKNHE